MKTTKKHVELFEKECKGWIDKFGLKGWRFSFFHEDWSEKYGEANAWSVWNQKGRTATFCLNPSWGWTEDKITDYLIKRTALHEVGHILLARLTDMAECYVAKDEVEEEAHSIIRRIENILLHEDA